MTSPRVSRTTRAPTSTKSKRTQTSPASTKSTLSSQTASSTLTSSSRSTSTATSLNNDISTYPLVMSTNEAEVTGVSPGSVAGIVTTLTGITVIAVLVALVIRLKQRRPQQHGHKLSTAKKGHLATNRPNCSQTDHQINPKCNKDACSSAMMADPKAGEAIFETPTVPNAAKIYVTPDNDPLHEDPDRTTYFELEDSAGLHPNDDAIDSYHRLRLQCDTSGLDAARLASLAHYDHLSVPTLTEGTHSDGDKYSNISRHGNGGDAIFPTSTAEDVYHSRQNDDQNDYSRLSREADGGGTTWSSRPSSEIYDRLQDTARPAGPTCDDYELAQVVSEATYANLS